MKPFQTNSIEIVRACHESFGFEIPSVLLKKNRKTRDVFSCVKFMFITCDKKINIVNIFILCTITVALYISAIKVIASLCILHSWAAQPGSVGTMPPLLGPAGYREYRGAVQ